MSGGSYRLRARMSTSPRQNSLVRLRARSRAFPSTFPSETIVERSATLAPAYRRRMRRRGTMPLWGATVANVWSYERSFGGVDRLQGLRLEDEPVSRSIESTHRKEFRNASP